MLTIRFRVLIMLAAFSFALIGSLMAWQFAGRFLPAQLASAIALALAVFVLALVGLLYHCLNLWVLRPLQQIMAAMQTRSIDKLQRLNSQRSEFDQFARMVRDFLCQQEALIEEIAERIRIESDLEEARDELEARVQARTAQLAEAYDCTIEGWSKALDLRDQETEGHCRRVTEMTVTLAAALGMSKQEIVEIRRGALLHDIGKMGIPDSILLKAGPLTDEESRVMRMHPVYARDLLSPIEFLQSALAIPYCHHEKWDGSGYPQGLAGEAIPIEARLFAIVDVWDALRSDRPYRKGWPDERVYEHIRGLAGTHFEPALVDLFLDVAINGYTPPDDAELCAIELDEELLLPPIVRRDEDEYLPMAA